ncbi:PrgI family protein [Actinoalloteichus caeruleus]|uniref:PrgI family protein n=1 Tax=Actinoalloteichus cyanogriseus TaxID=2893586 RepID=UPI003AAD99E2
MTQPVRIPADVDRPDRVLGTLTARQLVILVVAGLILYGGWTLAQPWVPWPVFLAVAIPFGAATGLLAVGQRDGLSLDRFVLAAWRQRRAPARRIALGEEARPVPDWVVASVTADATTTSPDVAEAPAALRLPARGVSEAGVIDLGRDGLAVVAVCSTVNFALRTPTEQEALVSSFGRYLHSLTAPVQILIRTERLDVSAQIRELHERAPVLPHPALETAAREHADYLRQLGEQTDLLRRQVLLILREPLHSPTADDSARPLRWRRSPDPHAAGQEAARRAAESRLVRRLAEAAELLGPSGIVVTPLAAGQATAVLASACSPDSLLPPSTETAGADEVITSATGAGAVDDLFDDGEEAEFAARWSV